MSREDLVKALKRLKRNVAEALGKDDLVELADACPCGERRVDSLVWEGANNEDPCRDHHVHCMSCGCDYVPWEVRDLEAVVLKQGEVNSATDQANDR